MLLDCNRSIVRYRKKLFFYNKFILVNRPSYLNQYSILKLKFDKNFYPYQHVFPLTTAKIKIFVFLILFSIIGSGLFFLFQPMSRKR